jgi:hypothetical protein
MSSDNPDNHIKEVFPKDQLIPEIIYKKIIPPPPSKKVPHEIIDLRNSKIDVMWAT